MTAVVTKIEKIIHGTMNGESNDLQKNKMSGGDNICLCHVVV